ncbi:hypothetical protein OsccyDRAFT_3578 [Leptolyngbyaceae cyanobacterium JSC-12]|nr:hypothetical protein OsccyDRAFT_3578 [Leptolyngbyaceae cyanobacterium JSC-12]
MYEEEPKPDPLDEYWELVKAGKEPTSHWGMLTHPPVAVPHTPLLPNDVAPLPPVGKQLPAVSPAG